METIGENDVHERSYQSFYKKLHSKLWPVELLISLFFSFVLYILNLNQLFAYSIVGFSLSRVQDLLVIMLSLPIIFSINYLFYKFVASYFLPYLNSPRRKALYILAISLILILSFLYLTLDLSQPYPWIWIDIVRLAMMLVLVTIPAAIAFGLIKTKRKNPFAHPSSPYIFLAIFLVLLLSTILATYLEPANDPWLRQAIGAMSITATSLENGILGLLYIIPYAPYFNTLESLRFSAALFGSLILIGILLLVSAFRIPNSMKKKWQSVIGIAIFIYGICQFMPLARFYEPELEWNFPIIEVSKKIEQEEQGRLYALAQNTDSINNYYPYLCSDQDVFTIYQDVFTVDASALFKKYRIDIGNLSDDQDPTVVADASYQSEEAENMEGCVLNPPLPEDVECRDDNDKKIEPEVIWDTDENGKEKTMYFISECPKLSYKNQTIFEEKHAESAGAISSIKLSDNKKWMLIEIANGAIYDQGEPYYSTSEHLYLVDLRSLE